VGAARLGVAHVAGQLKCPGDLPAAIRDQVATSAMGLRVHHDKTYPGALGASLSVPWGNSRDDVVATISCGRGDLWRARARFLALGQVDEARAILRYLSATQNEDGPLGAEPVAGGKPFGRHAARRTAFSSAVGGGARRARCALNAVEVRDMALGP